jgi:predicted enzyme related to lactoylglutathione lyase
VVGTRPTLGGAWTLFAHICRHLTALGGNDSGVLRLTHITFACDEPARVAEFWAELLDGYSAEPAGASWLARGDGPELCFNRMRKSPTIELPIHLDVNVPDREAELQRVLELGGKLVETKSHAIGELSETWTVMRDPEGNGFCIQSPPSTQVRTIGNVTFSSAEPVALGKFWAAALGWPDEPIDQGFLQQLLDAGMDDRELESFYVTRETPTSRPRLLFQRREKSRPASYPIHLDFRADDHETDLERLTGLGATVVETKSDPDRTWTVMRDPESNPFCVE